MFHVEQMKENRDNCPLCDSNQQAKFLESRDYGNTQEPFTIVECKGCGLKFTNPVPKEIHIGAYYKSENYISHTDSRKGLMNQVYHKVRKKAIRDKELLIARLTDERRLLDIGCGTGDFLKHCQDKKWQALGLEPDIDARNIAKEKAVEVNEIEALFNLEKESFDIITMWHVLEHVYHLKRDLSQIHKLIKPEGCLVLALPNHTSYDAKHYGEYWAAWDLPIHLYHFKPNDISNVAKQFGFSLEEVLPMKWDAYYVSMLSEAHQGKNKWKGLWQGWKSNRKGKTTEFSSQIYVLRKK